ncbi:hypothetical protein HYV82_06205 [Candidatus Woesearchaeota archaeon]|nr:hypothetical protein [Candidatus Woesearchaeota archaeon]
MANTKYNAVGFASPRIGGIGGIKGIGGVDAGGIGAGYRKKSDDDISILRAVKRFALTTAAVAAIAYVGARVDFDSWLDERFQGRKEIADSYADVSFYKRANAEGRLEPMLVYFPNGERRELPVLHGVEGPQAGNLEYVLGNTDFRQMTPEQRAVFSAKPWDDKSWEKLDVGKKYQQVRDELLKMLR